ncbi:hypothetical protein HDZ31DRAFT_67994 [Schizophyllum fasciatum]
MATYSTYMKMLRVTLTTVQQQGMRARTRAARGETARELVALAAAALSVFGIYPMSIDDQIASLARKRDRHIKRIRELEDELGVPHDEAPAPHP